LLIFKNSVPNVNDAPPSNVSSELILFGLKTLFMSILLSSFLIGLVVFGLNLKDDDGINKFLLPLLAFFISGYDDLYSNKDANR